MDFEVWGQTDVGLKRDINQDSILVDRKVNLFVVADGMGGHRGGEVASAIAVETMQEVFEDSLSAGGDVSPRDVIRSAYREASSRIFQKSTKENPELMGMGTTLVSAFAYKGKMYLANVGDSRVYLYRDGNLWQLTEDHSLINEQIRAGIVDPDAPESFVGRNVITRSVGFEENVLVDIVERELTPGEIYVMCSDGLSGLVTNDKINEICKSGDPKTIVEKGIELAKRAGGDDNISVVAIRVKA